MLSNKAFSEIQKHFSEIRNKKILSLFQEEGNKRAEEFTFYLEELTLDISKNLINKKTIELFVKLANEAGLPERILSLFSGKKINFTEMRAVGHIALRNNHLKSFNVDGVDYTTEIRNTKNRLYSFAKDFRAGKTTGYTGKSFDTVINIGIGGSYLGSAMACNALKEFDNKGIKVHFISNIDASNLQDILAEVNPETTLIIIASKTFTTQETIVNANTVKTWFIKNITTSDNQKALSKHFVALSTNADEVEKFGITKEYTFNFWDFVGGRYSIWSAIGLPLLLKIGEDNFEAFLKGACLVDEHMQSTPFEKNIPFLMAILGIWNGNLLNYKSYALIAYDYRLRDFARYLQQLEMESNGKSTNSKGNRVFYGTSPVVFGEVGTDSQHSFFQMLHQGTQIIPCDFIGFLDSTTEHINHQDILFANMLAQAEALMSGKSREQVAEEYKSQGLHYSEYSNIINHKVFDGNRPSSIYIFKSLSPKTLGMLCALHEHKIFIQGVLWNINSFDQYGVELGKKLSLEILSEIQKETSEDKQISTSGSTINLINLYKKNKEK